MERTAQNRVIFRANAKKEKSSNPYGYWIFQWEAVGFEPTVPEGTTDFEFYRRLLLTWFLLSVSVSLVRPQTRMKSGFFEEIARKY